MKIDRVILASNENKNYLDFWPIVSEAWKKLDVKPVLIYTGRDKIDLPVAIAASWIKKGLAEKISKKQNKDQIETKELKVEHVEIKSDDGN